VSNMQLSARQQAAIDEQEAWKLIYDRDGMQVYRNSEMDEFRTVGDTRKLACEMAQELQLYRWLTEKGLYLSENSVVNSPKWAVLDVDNELCGQADTPIQAIRKAYLRFEGGTDDCDCT